MGVFVYVHITPAFLILTLLLKLLSTHPFNALRFFPDTVFCKLFFQHEDYLANIIIQVYCIDIDNSVTLDSEVVHKKNFVMDLVDSQLL